MAGTLPNFDAAGFRSAIRFAMTMGAPPDADQQATFLFRKATTATGPTDASGVPYAPTTAVTRADSKAPVKVPCAIEEVAGSSVTTSLGTMAAGKVVITLLDDDYVQVIGTDSVTGVPFRFERVAVGGLLYRYSRELLQRGLGPVGIHRIECALEEGQ